MKMFSTALANRNHAEIISWTKAVGAPYIGATANTPLHHLVGDSPTLPLSTFDAGAWPNAQLVLQVADILDEKFPLGFSLAAHKPNADGKTPKEMLLHRRQEASESGRSTVHMDMILDRMER